MDTKALARIIAPGILFIVILSRLGLDSIVGTWGVEEASASSTLRRVTQLIPPGRMAEIFDILVLGQFNTDVPGRYRQDGRERPWSRLHAQSPTHQAPNVRGTERGTIPPPKLTSRPRAGHAIHSSSCLLLRPPPLRRSRGCHPQAKTSLVGYQQGSGR